jgi:hypothetical protein
MLRELMNIEPYEAPCGCFLRILPGGVVDELRCAACTVDLNHRLLQPLIDAVERRLLLRLDIEAGEP